MGIVSVVLEKGFRWEAPYGDTPYGDTPYGDTPYGDT
jgi:hypothetical protein